MWQITPNLTMFFWGALGSCSVHVVQAFRAYEDGQGLPPKFRMPTFWMLCGILAAVGGLLVVAYDIRSAVVAINVGASTPLILQTFSQTPPRIAR